MKYVGALVTVTDMRRARRFYEDVLGQKVSADYSQDVGFEGGFSLHEREHFKALLDGRPVGTGSNASELYFEEDDLVALQERLLGEGVEFAHRVREQPWRQQVMRFYDYDGNLIEVGERLEHEAYRLSLEGLSVAEIARYTYLGEEAIREAIRNEGR